MKNSIILLSVLLLSTSCSSVISNKIGISSGDSFVEDFIESNKEDLKKEKEALRGQEYEE